jgi:hypothetical protein
MVEVQFNISEACLALTVKEDIISYLTFLSFLTLSFTTRRTQFGIKVVTIYLLS